MSELRSALESLRAEVLPELPDARIEEDFAELQRIGELLELERLRRLAEIERRGLFGRDGHLSGAAWLAERFGVAWGSARGMTRTARALEQMPATRVAVQAGEVTLSAETKREATAAPNWSARSQLSAIPDESWSSA